MPARTAQVSGTLITASEWLITSANGLVQETITLAGAPMIDASDFVFV